MSAASDYLEIAVLDHVLSEGVRNYTASTTLHVALFVGTSGPVITNLEAGTVTDEVPNLYAYARTACIFGAAAAGTASNSANITFPAASGGNWGTVTVQAIVDSATYGAGNVLFAGALTVAKTITDGDTFQISTGNLDVTMA